MMDIILNILKYAGWTFIMLGSVTFLLSAIGILRMPDAYTRIHAGTKASTLGTILILIGVGMIQPAWFLKLLLLSFFILLTNPISSSVLTRSAYRRGAKFVNTSGIDMYKDDIEKMAEEKQEEE